MVLPFKEEVVNESEYSQENFENPNFIGYLNKYGNVLEYSYPLGFGGHSTNKFTKYFEYYFCMPMHDYWLKELKGIDSIDLDEERWYARKNFKYFWM